MNAITNPIAIRAFTPVKAMPRYRPPMTFSDWNLCCLPGIAVPYVFCLPCRHHAGGGGFVPAEKYKSELKGKVFHSGPWLRNNFSPVPVGDRTDEVSTHRYRQPRPGCLRGEPRQWGRKPARWPPFTGGFLHEYLNVAGTAPPTWEASLGMGGCPADMTDFP